MNTNTYPIMIAVNGNEVYSMTAKTTTDEAAMLKKYGTVKEATEVRIGDDSYIIAPDGKIYGGYHSQYRGNGITLHGWNKYGFEKTAPAIKVKLVAMRCKLYG